jgi:hypothetical protein
MAGFDIGGASVRARGEGWGNFSKILKYSFLTKVLSIYQVLEGGAHKSLDTVGCK